MRIAKWNETFEDAKSRKLVSMRYLQMPLDINSNGYINLMACGEAGLKAYGVFLGICQLSAARRPEHRGKVCRSDGSPLSEKQLASHLRIALGNLSAALELLKSDDIAWIIDDSGDGEQPACQPSVNDPPPATQDRPDKTTEHKEKEHKTTDRQTADRRTGGGTTLQRKAPTPASDGQSVGQSSIFDQLWDIDPMKVDRDCKRFREISGVGKSRIPEQIVIELCFLSRWQDNEMFRGIAHKIRDPDVPKKKAYVSGAIRNRCKDLGVDDREFRDAVAAVVLAVTSKSEAQRLQGQNA